jgi:ABC-type Fe3+/spermidine/putrescine transport system ATPase subunit
MFDDQLFEDWLDKKTKAIFLKLGEEAISSDEMILLVLKAQTNHFEHLDKDLRTEMSSLNKELREEMILLRQDMDKRFEQVDRRFEQVDKRFEQVDKRFEVLTSRIDHFMVWSFATTLTVGGLVIAAIKFLP